MEIISKSEEETLLFAQEYARQCQGGEILGLVGDLGSGKTVFTKGLAQGLGIKQGIASPTFNLMRLYEIREPINNINHLCHIDAYRIQSEFEIIDIGAEDYIGRKDILTVIEWADRIRDILPSRTKIINFQITEDKQRKITTEEKEMK